MGDNNNNSALVESFLNAPVANLQASKVVESSQISQSSVQSSSIKISSSSSTKISSSSSMKKSVSESTSILHQVKEGSRAESVGIKLGDSIIRINGIPTAGMSLNEAQRALEYAGDDLRLTLSR